MSTSKTHVNEANWKPVYTKVLLYTHRGWPDQRIAEAVGLSRRTIQYVRGSDYFCLQLTKLTSKTIDRMAETESTRLTTERARDILVKNSILAAKRITRIMRKKLPISNDRITLEAAQDVLDRVGIKGPTLIQTCDKVYSPEEIDSAKRTLDEIQEIMVRLNNQQSAFLLTKPRATQEPALTDESSSVAQTIPPTVVEEVSG